METASLTTFTFYISVSKYYESLLDGTETKEVVKPKIDEEVKAAKESGLNFNVLCFMWLCKSVLHVSRLCVYNFSVT